MQPSQKLNQVICLSERAEDRKEKKIMTNNNQSDKQKISSPKKSLTTTAARLTITTPVVCPACVRRLGPQRTLVKGC